MVVGMGATIALAPTAAWAQERTWSLEQDWDREPAIPAPKIRFSDRPLQSLGTLGIGTLVGFAGITAGYSFHDQLQVGAGFGTNGQGPIGGPYLRVRPLVRANGSSGTLHAMALDLG